MRFALFSTCKTNFCVFCPPRTREGARSSDTQHSSPPHVRPSLPLLEGDAESRWLVGWKRLAMVVWPRWRAPMDGGPLEGEKGCGGFPSHQSGILILTRLCDKRLAFLSGECLPRDSKSNDQDSFPSKPPCLPAPPTTRQISGRFDGHGWKLQPFSPPPPRQKKNPHNPPFENGCGRKTLNSKSLRLFDRPRPSCRVVDII